MPSILSANTLSSGFDVANSCRFDDGSSDHMHKTPGSAGSRIKWTFSVWLKRGVLGAMPILAVPGGDTNNYDEFYFNGSDKIQYSAMVSGTQYALRTARVFRDTTAWMHLALIYDSNNGTAGDRMQLWVNGVRTAEADFEDTTFKNAQNYSSSINNDKIHYLGKVTTNTAAIFDGYMTEVVFQNNSADSPVDKFGEFDEDSGIWKPIGVSGLTLGTNGFYLDFEDSSNLGNDVGGGTDLTEVNIDATNQSTDTCTNNFCTLTPLTKLTDATLSEGNLNVTYGTASTRRAVFGSIVVTAGKWFCETKVIATSQTSVEMNLGISNTYNPEAIGNALVSNNGFTVSYFPAGSGGALYIGTTNDESSLGALAVNDIIGMAIDMDNGTLQFYKNGSALGSANDITTGDSDDGELYPGFTIANSCSSGGQTFTASHNFGSPAYSESGGNSDADGFGNFSMSVPSGFFSICTKNLAEYG